MLFAANLSVNIFESEDACLLIIVYVMQQGCLKLMFYNNKWALRRVELSSGVCNNKRADRPAHPRSLTIAFVIRFLKSKIYYAQ